MRIALGSIRSLDDETLAMAKQLGASGIQIVFPVGDTTPYWTTELLTEAKKACEAHGLVLESAAAHIYPAVMLGTADRDKELEYWITSIRNMGKVGIPVMGHDWMPNSVWRTTPQPVRGGALATAFDASELDGLSHLEQRKFAASWAAYIDDVFSLASEHEFTEEEMWANYEYFLKAALPEAEAAGVVLALHPDDPPMPMLGRIARPFSTVAGFKKAEAFSNGSPAWKVLACLGTFAEMEGGAANAFDVVRHFGPRGKIAYVHFRVVKGAIPSFVETYLGDGSWEPLEMMRALQESGFNGFIMDDHVPHSTGDTQYGHRSRAHALGYMQGLFNALGVQSPR